MEQKIAAESRYNMSLDLFKFIAACSVVFVHVRFPGEFGRVLSCLSRFSVPGFFAVSGFFSYRAGAQQLEKRIRHMVVLNLWGIVLTFLWAFVGVELHLGELSQYHGSLVAFIRINFPDWEELVAWLVTDASPFNWALWYLMAILKCYCILWCYVRSFGKTDVEYQWFYLAGLLLFSVSILLGVVSSSLGQPFDEVLLRGTLLMGIPMFAMGMYLRQHWENIWKNFALSGKKLIGLMVLGILLCLVEWKAIGMQNVLIGAVIAVISVLLLAARYPRPLPGTRRESAVKFLGRMSIGIYLAHTAIRTNDFLFPLFEGRIPRWEWIYPLVILFLSLGAATVNDLLWRTWKHRKKANKRKARTNAGFP